MKKVYFLICLLFLPFSVSAQQYEITNYYIDVVVNENNIYSIEEYYNLSFIETSEFTRTIQLRPKVHLSNGKFISYAAKVTDLKTNESVKEKESSKNYKVTFPISSIGTIKAISIGYKYNMGKDLDDNYDIASIRISDGSFEVPEYTVSFSVTLPCTVEKEYIKFYQNGTEVDESKIDYTVMGTHIDGTMSDKIDIGDIVELQVLLPEGTFKNIVRTNSRMCYFWPIAPILTAILSFIMVKKFKRKKLKRIENPFAIANEFDSVEMAYLYKGKINATDFISLIFKLANDGYISLKNFGSKDNVSFKIKKEKEYDKDNAAQKILFDGLFQNREEVDIHDIEGVFYPYYTDAKRTLQNKQNETKLFYKTNKLKKLLRIGIYLELLFLQIKPLYNLLDSYVFGIIASIIISAILIFAYQPKNKFLKYILLTVSGVIFLLEGYALFEVKLDFYMYCIAFVLSEITLLLESIIPIRTIYGAQKHYEVDTFKLELASMLDETFNMKTKENENYFFGMIPYTIVFDLTRWWFERFGSTVSNAPKWYESSESFTSDKLLEFIEAVVLQLAIPIQTSRMYSDELLQQAPNKLL